MPRSAGALAALLCAAGCAMGRNDFVRLNPGTSFPSRPVEAPVVLTVSGLDKPYQEIGVIHVSGLSRDGYEKLNEQLRAKAREVGADAVIYVHYGLENVLSIIPFFVALPYNVLTAEGVAVRTR
jgi:hypothetical protein